MGRARPSRSGIDLLEFMLCLGVNFAVFGEENGARTGGSLIECKDVGHGRESMFSDETVFHILATKRQVFCKMPRNPAGKGQHGNDQHSSSIEHWVNDNLYMSLPCNHLDRCTVHNRTPNLAQ